MIAIERFFNIRAAYAPTFSPDGRRLAFIATITGVPQVWVMDAHGGWPDPVTFGDDRVMNVAWSTAGNTLLFARDIGGNENAQLFVVNADGSGERRVTTDDGAMHIFGAWSPDGRAIAYAANRRDRARYDLYWQDIEMGEERLIWRNEALGFFWPAGFSPDGRQLLINHLRGNMDNDLYELTLPSAGGLGELRNVTPHAGDARFVNPVYSASGRAAFLASDVDRDLLALLHLNLNTLQLSTIEAPAAEVEEAALSPDAVWLAWAENHDGAHVLRARRLATGATITAPLPTGVVYPAPSDVGGAALSFSPGDSHRLAFAFTTPTRTADIWTWDLDTNRAGPVSRSSHAGIPSESLAEPELIHYATFDGLSIPAWFYRATPPTVPEAQHRPTIVYVHGGPEGQTQAMLFPLFQYFTQRGFHVLAPNVRGSSGYGKHYLNLDNVERRLDSVADLAHAVYWLRQQPDVAGDRIAVYGGSYGGFMVLAALTRYPDLWAAGVDIVGIANFVTFLENTGAYRRAVREAEYGSLAHHHALLTELSPIHMVDRIRAPLFVIHGRNDPRVPLGEAQQIVDALQARGVPVEFRVYDDEGHGLVKLANKVDAYPRVAEFLDKHLFP
jgi:dipeptidyl aminopeptidase/acylaminoacyl peptidase